MNTKMLFFLLLAPYILSAMETSNQVPSLAEEKVFTKEEYQVYQTARKMAKYALQCAKMICDEKRFDQVVDRYPELAETDLFFLNEAIPSSPNSLVVNAEIPLQFIVTSCGWWSFAKKYSLIWPELYESHGAAENNFSHLETDLNRAFGYLSDNAIMYYPKMYSVITLGKRSFERGSIAQCPSEELQEINKQKWLAMTKKFEDKKHQRQTLVKLCITYIRKNKKNFNLDVLPKDLQEKINSAESKLTFSKDVYL